jgi:HK97 family phage portal protein
MDNKPSFIRRLFNWNTTETLGAAADPGWGIFADAYGAIYAPDEVTIQTAETNTSVTRAINLIMNDVGRLPVCTVDENGDESDELYGLLERPSELETGFDFFRKHVRHLMLWGNAFALISRNGRGEVVQLISCNPQDITQIDKGNGLFTYRHTIHGEVAPKDVLHFRLKGRRPFWGDSPITMALDALNLAKTQDAAGMSQYRVPGLGKIALEIPETVGPDKVKAGQESFKRTHGSRDGHLAPIIVQNGTQVKQVGQSLKDADWITSRRFSITEVARMYSIPPAFLFDLEHSTLENSSMMLKSYVSTCLEHWLEYFRSEFKLKLDVDIKFDTTQLLTGTFKEEVESLRMAIDCGVLTPNEARAKLGYEAHAEGDDLMISKNYQEAGVNGTSANSADQPNEDSNKETDS